MPGWGRFGLGLAGLSWVLAWTRPPGLGPLNDHTFFPLWLGYVLTMDGLVYARRGRSRLSMSPRGFAMLFVASAVIWWYFDFLNRLVQNWWYESIERFSGAHYVLFATLCFSTVLPAILETADWLGTFHGFTTRYRRGPAIPALPRWILPGLVLAGAAGLLAMAVAPNPLFFLTWISPLAVTAGMLAWMKRPTPFDSLARGDYTALFTLAVSALVCGLFWELWNFRSLPKWHYSIPYVYGWRLFEMPLVGYAGYLPFGPICWCMWETLRALVGQPGEKPIGEQGP
jgi:hypothetical protein